MNEALEQLRRTLHANPELSGNEKMTQQRIKDFLRERGITTSRDIGKYGTLYSFDFGEGPHVLVRVDIDALAIREINTMSYASKVNGVSHKCGHDGHTAIGAGLAWKLQSEPLSKGQVTLLFQPAEEIGEGARGVLDDEAFDASEYDYAIALHNIPGRPQHEIIWKYDGFTPAVHSLVVRLKGRTSHAAEPLKGINPSYAIAKIIEAAKDMEDTDEESVDYNLITPVFVTIGSRDYGISAGEGEVHFTIRSWEQEKMEAVTQAFCDTISEITEPYKLELETELIAVFAANKNNPKVTDAIKEAATRLGLKLHRKEEPFPWGEDFGLFTQHLPGAMFGLGSGEKTPALHNPDYDFPDAITETGVNMFYETIINLCDHV